MSLWLARLHRAILSNEGFDDGDDLILLAARQSRNLLESGPGTTQRSGRDSFSFSAKQRICGDAESACQFSKRVTSHCRGFALPLRHGLLADAELLSELHLRKSGLLAQARKAVTETGARMFSGSATRMHGGIIRVKCSGEGLSNKQQAHRYNNKLVTGEQSNLKRNPMKNGLTTFRQRKASHG